ncbi:MAG: hypothetical protein ACPLRJ_02800 [Infirmifilum uzonense]|uniref:hypothetical protein n=1 Tax=Infirmifilum uzonense TaxID=1550241 RepID=UPI003C73A2D4
MEPCEASLTRLSARIAVLGARELYRACRWYWGIAGNKANEKVANHQSDGEPTQLDGRRVER